MMGCNLEALIEVGTDHRLADPEPLSAMLRACERGSMIRKYRDEDLDDLLAAWAAASEIAHPFLTPDFLALERDNIPNMYLPNAETWVFEDAGRVVGFMSLLGNEVGAIFVHPDQQRRGVGRLLMDKAQELRGELAVEVFKANSMGRAFYAKYGFETVAEKVHEQTGFDLLRLRLRHSRLWHD